MELTTRTYLRPTHADGPFLSLDVSGLRVSTFIMADKPEELRAFRASLVQALEDVDTLLALPAKQEAVPTTDHDDRPDGPIDPTIGLPLAD